MIQGQESEAASAVAPKDTVGAGQIRAPLRTRILAEGVFIPGTPNDREHNDYLSPHGSFES